MRGELSDEEPQGGSIALQQEGPLLVSYTLTSGSPVQLVVGLLIEPVLFRIVPEDFEFYAVGFLRTD